MNLLKLLKIFEVVWPFIKEILLDKDTPAPDRRKKAMTLVLTLMFIFFGSGGWTTVKAYVTPFLPPNQVAGSSDTYRDIEWVQFLERRLAENATIIMTLQREVATATVLHHQETRRADALQARIDALTNPSPMPSTRRPINARILNRLEKLRNTP